MHRPVGEYDLVNRPKTRVAIFLSNLDGGGAERVTINLLKGFSPEMFTFDLILISATGPFLTQVPAHVNIIDLKQTGVTGAILPLAQYLRKQRPDILMSHLSHVNVGALVARKLALSQAKVILVEHNDLSSKQPQKGAKKFRLSRNPQRQFLPKFMEYFYRQADAVIGVSLGVSRYVGQRFGVSNERLHMIYNPIVDDELLTRSRETPEHPWLRDLEAHRRADPPVLLAVGRLTPQKDFATLLRAFAIVRRTCACRLIILGEGAKRPELEALVRELELTDDVSLPGFAANPYAAMSRASLYVLSSRWEGLPTVLVEAMACGCPVVATDCPSGPDEILESGRYGPLVPVADPEALAEAILKTLAAPTDGDMLRRRAADFTYERAINAYTALMLSLAGRATEPTRPRASP